MSIVIITGSCGLIGSESVSFFCSRGFDVAGIDNNLRRKFFGQDANILWNKNRLKKTHKNYTDYSIDIRDSGKINNLFKRYNADIALIIHAAAQPSHDWAANEPLTDFTVNASGTMVLLEAFRKYAKQAVFIFTSTNKVYGDRPNSLPLIELEKRYDLREDHPCYNGIDENMSIDNCLHSLFGASKVSADIMTQEYGRYFGLKTAIFRGGCLTGPCHSGAELHGFLSYLVRCCIMKRKYIIYGYKGKQVRDNIHSYDLVSAFYHFFNNPACGEVYNIGGGRWSNCSVLEAIDLCQEVTKARLNYEYSEANRIGDHIWWLSNVSKFKSHYPQWDYKYSLKDIIREIYEMQKEML